MKFLTIHEASTYAGKPDITIRRLIKKVIDEKKSDRKKHVKKEKRGARFIYKISSELLDTTYGKSNNKTAKKEVMAEKVPPKKKEGSALDSLVQTVAILQAQLEVKDRQLEKMQELVRNEQVLSLQQGRGKVSFWGRVFGVKK